MKHLTSITFDEEEIELLNDIFLFTSGMIVAAMDGEMPDRVTVDKLMEISERPEIFTKVMTKTNIREIMTDPFLRKEAIDLIKTLENDL